MPDPGKYTKKKNFISDCMKTVHQEGKKDQQQAAGQCYGMWKNKKKKKKKASDIIRQAAQLLEKM